MNEIFFNVRQQDSHWVVDAVDKTTFTRCSYAVSDLSMVGEIILQLQARLLRDREKYLEEIEQILHSQSAETFNPYENSQR